MTKKGSGDMDYPAHDEMYGLFITMVKYGTIAMVIVLAFLWFFIF